MDCRENAIIQYFFQGYAYKEILALLVFEHNIMLSLRQLKRILQKLDLGRRVRQDSHENVEEALRVELEGSGCNLGYKAMHHKLSTIYRIRTSRETVRIKLKKLDPTGVENRSIHRLKRRQYVCKGPNYSWHLDGYDKLKPYGFCIHGCIDGYSRKILWLHVSSTNNDPAIIASYFVGYVTQIKGTARRIRGDFGTENVNIAGAQRFFRDNQSDSFCGEKSFMFGKSTSNQRIEALWSKLRQSTTQFWMDFFKDMQDAGEIEDSDELYSECLRFCFTQIVQNHLDQTRILHNSHLIRRYPNQECPSGRPNFIYAVPEAYDSCDYRVNVDSDDILLVEQIACRDKEAFGCSAQFFDLATAIMSNNGWEYPRDEIEAKKMYFDLKKEIFNLT